MTSSESIGADLLRAVEPLYESRFHGLARVEVDDTVASSCVRLVVLVPAEVVRFVVGGEGSTMTLLRELTRRYARARGVRLPVDVRVRPLDG